ncbi:hypothetical protein L9F63_010082, partial [Diploptera punctata]
VSSYGRNLFVDQYLLFQRFILVHFLHILSGNFFALPIFSYLFEIHRLFVQKLELFYLSWNAIVFDCFMFN